MILNLIILVALVWAFMVGYSRGLILQVIYSFGTIIAAFIAASNYKELAQKLSIWVPFSNATENSRPSRPFVNQNKSPQILKFQQ